MQTVTRWFGSERSGFLFIAAAILVALVSVTYRDAPQNAFHFDDERNITRHQPIMIDALTFENIMHAGREALLPNRPLPNMTFAIDWWRGGGSPRSFQQTNVAIHGATALAVFALLFVVLRHNGQSARIAGWAALVAAALWASHPIQVQAVTYIVQRMASMATLFTVLTVLVYVLARARVGWRRAVLFACAGFLWVLGLASKETAAIAAFLVLLAEYGVVRQGQLLVRGSLDRWLLAVPLIVVLFVGIDILSGAGPLSAAFLPGYELRDFTLAERLMTQPRVIAFHLSQILWPVPGRFSLEHDLVISSGLLEPATTIFALSGVLSWCTIGVWSLFRRASRTIGFFMLWVPATLVIESSFIPLEMVFEHRMYLPSVGLAGLVAILAVILMNRAPRYVPVTLAVCFALAVLMVISTGRQVLSWQSTLRLAQQSVEVAPNNARAWATLAGVLQNSGRDWGEVLPPVARALELNPNELRALHVRAMYLVETRRLEEAALILKALEPKADIDHSILNTLGMLRLGQRDFPSAIAYFERASQLDPFRPEFKYNLALSYELHGRCADALSAWQVYLTQDTHPQRLSSVRARLAKNFEAEGGRCYSPKK